MKIFRLATIATSALSVIAAASAQPARRPVAQGAAPAGGNAQNTAQTITQVKPGLYMVTGAGAIVLVRVTNEGIVLFNTKSIGQMNYDNLMAQIKTVSDKPVKYVIVGNVHQDQSGNTSLFIASGAQVIAQENEKAGLATYKNAAGTAGPPNVTYKTDYSIKMDGKEVAHLYHWGATATNGDTIAYFPDLKVVAMGDALRPATINADYPQGGSLLEWPKTLEGVLKLDFDVAVPQLGNLGTRADVEAELKRLNGLSAAAIDLVKKGATEDEIIAKIDAVDPTLHADKFTENNKGRLDAFFAEVSRAVGK